MLKKLALIVLTITPFSPLFCLPLPAQTELETYIGIFQGEDIDEQRIVAQKLEWSGFSQTSLFDQIELLLKNHYLKVVPDYPIDHLSWFAKALAYSGNEKYLVTLKRVEKHSPNIKLRKYGKESVLLLKNYSEWNNIILDQKTWNHRQSVDFNRFKNMVTSDIYELKRLAAKRIHHRNESKKPLPNELLQVVKKEVLLGFKSAKTPIEVDTFAWLLRALASTRQPSFKPVIQNVKNNAQSRKLRRYANEYIEHYYR